MRAFRRILPALAVCSLLAGLLPGAAVAQTTGKNPSHEDILRGFDASALWASREDVGYGGTYNPVGLIVRWQRPIVYKVEGLGFKPDMIAFAVTTLKRQAAIAGIEVREAGDGVEPNYQLVFRDVASFSLGGRKASCYMTPRFDYGSGHMQSVTLQINLSSYDLERCIIHEILHGFGLFNHPHRLHSVLSYYTTNFVFDITEADEVMLRSLYDKRIKPGMSRLNAIIVADVVIEEKRRALNPAAPAKTDPAPVLRDILLDLEKAAQQGGNARAMLYLAEAAWRGYGMPKDMAKVQGQIDRIAGIDDINARFELAYALVSGRYVPRNESRAVTLYQRNADLGHKISQNNLALLLRDGRGVPEDKAAALAWFIISAGQDFEPAELHRRKLVETLPPDLQEVARARAAAWKPAPEAAR